jgi:glutaredoxin 3
MTKIDIYLTASCPYCVRAKNLLDNKGVTYREKRIDLDSALEAEMYQRAKQFTVPQIFIGETHVGGCDDMFLLEMNGQLDGLLFPQDQ